MAVCFKWSLKGFVKSGCCIVTVSHCEACWRPQPSRKTFDTVNVSGRSCTLTDAAWWCWCSAWGEQMYTPPHLCIASPPSPPRTLAICAGSCRRQANLSCNKTFWQTASAASASFPLQLLHLQGVSKDHENLYIPAFPLFFWSRSVPPLHNCPSDGDLKGQHCQARKKQLVLLIFSRLGCEDLHVR